jgi:hypothetical protein
VTVRVAAMRDPAVKQILPELGKMKNAINGQAHAGLGAAVERGVHCRYR